MWGLDCGTQTAAGGQSGPLQNPCGGDGGRSRGAETVLDPDPCEGRPLGLVVEFDMVGKKREESRRALSYGLSNQKKRLVIS